METEKFISGYCRQLDQSRMVFIVFGSGNLEECDCCFGNCIYEDECPVAAQIRSAVE